MIQGLEVVQCLHPLKSYPSGWCKWFFLWSFSLRHTSFWANTAICFMEYYRFHCYKPRLLQKLGRCSHFPWRVVKVMLYQKGHLRNRFFNCPETSPTISLKLNWIERQLGLLIRKGQINLYHLSLSTALAPSKSLGVLRVRQSGMFQTSKIEH